MSKPATLFLCGDVMTGRGIDQILPHPGNPALHESYVKNALDYVRLAEQSAGPISRPAGFSYIWGEALEELRTIAPDLSIINLETSITTSSDFWPAKAVHYRMDPRNIACLTAAGIDCCVLGNNHVLDFGYQGLEETLATLRKAGLACAGAGANSNEAEAPAVLEIKKTGGRCIVFGIGSTTSGISPAWAATADGAGVNLVRDLSDRTAEAIGKRVRKEAARQGDVVVASIHWGSNWGYEVPQVQQRFAHFLVDQGADIVHGHSSHHVKGIEVYKDRPILYGCGDFLNDYEGISGYEGFRGDLGLMYFATIDTVGGKLLSMRMAPTQVRRLRVNRAPAEDARWLRSTLDRECKKFGCRIDMQADGSLALAWG
ncbi:MAG: CapA family protein [Chloroflexi bacterium]|nr:CapA family protein [Chloroflexota bacterium]